MKEVWGQLQAAVKAGKMSQEDAHRKMGAIKKAVFFFSSKQKRMRSTKSLSKPFVSSSASSRRLRSLA